MFTALGTEYRQQAFEVITKLCPGSLCRGAAALEGGGGLSSLLGEAVDVWLQRASFDPADRVVKLEVVGDDPDDVPGPIAERFIDSLAGSAAASRSEGYGEARLDYLHLLLPHRPFQYLPSGAHYSGDDPSRSFSDNSYPDEAAAELARDRHLLQLQYADSLLGELLDELERLGTYDETAIVVTADHGASFTPGSHRRGVTEDNWWEILWTPFLLKAPGQVEGAVVDEPTRSIDVLPTLLDVLDTKPPFQMDGVSGFEPRPDDYREEVVLQDWKENILHPAEDEDYLSFDPSGIEQVLEQGPWGRGDDYELRVLRRGLYGELVGTSVAEATVGDDADFGGRLDGTEELASIDPASNERPLYRTGTLQTEGEVRVAVALDGTIANVVDNQARGDGKSELWVVLSDRVLVTGAESVDLYLVEGESGDPVLRPIPSG